MAVGVAWRRSVMTVVVPVLLLTSATQADYQTGLDAYQQGDFEKAHYEWIKVAVSKEGEAHPAVRAESEYALGMLYWLGQGVEQDTSAAAVWLREAAELDHAGAQSKLGYLYLSGEGVPHNDFEALKWLQMAAYKNDADAQYNLGIMYRDGMGVDPDPGQSMYWFRQAADNGDPVSAGIVSDGVFMDPAFDQSASAESAPIESTPEESTAEPGEPNAATDSAGATPSSGIISTPPAAEDKMPDENWIQERDSGHYTIQVIALQNPDKLQMFIGQHPDLAPFAIYQQQLKGKPIYVLIQGDYADVKQAQEAVRMFPSGFQKREELWIRRFIMVQGLLN